MTKKELVDLVYQKRGIENIVTKKAVSDIVDGVFSELINYFIRTKIVKNKIPKFTYPGFGSFVKTKRASRPGRNPKTGENIQIPALETLCFKINKDLKNLLNNRRH